MNNRKPHPTQRDEFTDESLLQIIGMNIGLLLIVGLFASLFLM